MGLYMKTENDTLNERDFEYYGNELNVLNDSY